MLIGRARQLAELAAQAHAIAATGSARVAWLSGAEGVGKSTLAMHAAQASALPLISVEVYPEDEYEPPSAVQVLADALGVELGPDPAQDLLRGLESHGPVCVLIEDAQWLDATSQQAIWKVLRRSQRLPVWLIVTSTETSSFLFDGLALLVRRADRGLQLRVSSLDIEQTAEFIADRLGLVIDGEALTRVFEITGGYPGLLDSLAEQLHEVDEPHRLASELRRVVLRSQTSSGLLRQHVDAVMADPDPRARTALLALAQTGELSSSQIHDVLQIQGLPDLPLRSLDDTGLVDRVGDDGLRVRHQLLQRALLDRVSVAEDRASHRALAQVLGGVRGLRHLVAGADASNQAEVLARLTEQVLQAYLQRDFVLAFHFTRLGAQLDPSWLRGC